MAAERYLNNFGLNFGGMNPREKLAKATGTIYELWNNNINKSPAEDEVKFIR